MSDIFMNMPGVCAHEPFSLTIKDPCSAGTHFIGAVASAVAAPFLILHYVESGADFLSVISACVFVLSMFLLYSASTAYHTVVVSCELDKKFKKLDHMMIFVLIAGSYTPFCLITLRESCGVMLLACIWGMALLGMVFKFLWVTCPKWVSSVIYIGMGWMVVFALPQIMNNIQPKGFWYLLAGGIVYTIGGVIYALKLSIFNSRHNYFGSHEIFHLFVMAGNLLHFIAIYYYVL